MNESDLRSDVHYLGSSENKDIRIIIRIMIIIMKDDSSNSNSTHYLLETCLQRV